MRQDGVPTTSKNVAIDDARVQDVIRAVRVLYRETKSGEALTIKRLEALRRERPELSLPATNTLYKVCTWPEALDLAKIRRAEPRPDQHDREPYYADMRYVAKELGVERLSTHVYDDFRRRHPELGLKSSSAIRKYCDKWEHACEGAGLSAPQRALSRKATRHEMIHSGRLAWRALQREMTPDAYRRFCADHDIELPTVEDILGEFRSWESFCREAQIEVIDDLDPAVMWTPEEVHRAAKWALRELGGSPIDETSYTRLYQRHPRRLPPWAVLITVVKTS